MKKLIIILEKRITDSLSKAQVFGSVAFWNDEGERVYQGNVDGKLGNPSTQQSAREEGYETFVLNGLLADCKTTIAANCPDEYMVGRSGSHIWISRKESKERVVLIHF